MKIQLKKLTQKLASKITIKSKYSTIEDEAVPKVTKKSNANILARLTYEKLE